MANTYLNLPLEIGGGGGSPTNLSNTINSTSITILSSTGTSTILPAATSLQAGVMSALQFTLLSSAPQPFVFIQPTPSATWTINHNLGYFPSVTLFTSGGVEFEADIININTNIVQVLLNNPLIGTARAV